MGNLSLLISLLAIITHSKCCLEVTINSGRLLGTLEKTSSKGHPYFAFKGIRYAEEPKRFEPPVPAKPWEGVYDATEDKPFCIQAPFGIIGQTEDCLFINVYTPKFSTLDSNQRFPVIFWIYGGGFNTGNSHFSEHNPEYLVEENVTVVTINYRLNCFGFLSSGDDQIPGNNGLRDLILGLQWTQHNIEQFNGDPNRVTLFGQSAGAALASYLIMSPLTQGKNYFHRAIMQSGNALSAWALQQHHRDVYKSIMQNTNCVSLECLQNASTEAIIEAQIEAMGDPVKVRLDALNGMTFAPVIDGEVITEPAYSYLKKPEIANIPFIMGITSEEGLSLEKYLSYFKPIFQNPSLLVPKNMYLPTESAEEDVASKLELYYFNGDFPAFEVENITKYISGSMYNKPMREYFTLVEDKVPSYCYVFSYIGHTSQWHSIEGVGHAEEIGYIWKDFWNASLTSDDLKVKEKMVRLWANFAKDGNPTSRAEDLLDHVIWPIAHVSGTNVNCLNIDESLSTIQNPKEEEYQMWKELYSFGNPKDTY